MIKKHIKNKKHVLFVVLLLLLSIAFVFSPSVQAGSSIQIKTIDDLWNIRNDLSGDYILMNNLDFKNTAHYKGNATAQQAKMLENTTDDGWLPIGEDWDNPFNGTFNGQNYTISNFFINRYDLVGLFGYTEESEIMNLGLVNVVVTGYSEVGALAGCNIGIISNCYVTTGSVTGDFNIGGLVGDNWDAYIIDCYTSIQVLGETCVGGLIGRNINSPIEKSYAKGHITGRTDDDNVMGGLIGYNDGNITNCYATGNVVSNGKNSWYLGGLIGDNKGNITNCYATGNVVSKGNNSRYIGGLIGYNKGNIANCYSAGKVEGNYIVGGLVGQNTGFVNHSFYDKSTTGQVDTGKGVGLPTANMKNIATFSNAGWDIEYSSVDRNNGYPYFAWQNNIGTSVWLIKQPSSNGDGNDGGGGYFPPPAKPPVADASKSATSGLINTPVTFDGSNSYDEEGEITNYTWDFGDGNYGYGVITTHIYENVGIYTVKLTVTNDISLTDTDTFKVIISIPSSPPTTPQVDGPKTGRQNIEYTFTVFSTDPDNETIKYIFDWSDGETDESEFLPSGTVYNQTHVWITAGVFKIKVFTADINYTVSNTVELNILIDVLYCGALGYLIDEDSDGTYDLFFSNQTGLKTAVLKQNDGTYLINSDTDADWDYTYNTETGAINSYTKAEPETKPTNYLEYAVIVAIIVVILLVLLIIATGRNKKVKPVKKEVQTTKEKLGTKKKKAEPKKEKIKTTKKKEVKKEKTIEGNSNIEEEIDKMISGKKEEKEKNKDEEK